MKQIIYQLATQKGIGSAVIRAFSWSEFSHVDIVLLDLPFPWWPSDVGWLIGARSHADTAPRSGVFPRRPDYAKFTKTQKFSVAVTDEQHLAFWDFIAAQVGKPYDMTAITQFVTHGERDWTEDDSWFCSELAAAGFKAARIPFFNWDVRVNHIMPEHLRFSPMAVKI